MTIKEQLERASSSDYLTVNQLALMLQYDPWTVYRQAAKGKIPGAVKIGRNWRFIRVEVKAWVENKRRFHPSPKAIYRHDSL